MAGIKSLFKFCFWSLKASRGMQCAAVSDASAVKLNKLSFMR